MLCWVVPRHQTGTLLLLYGGAFLSWLALSKFKHDMRFGMLAGIILRLLILPSPPIWSDDFYRFIWDGRLIQESISPWLFTPAQVVFLFPSLTTSPEYEFLNSQHYLSVYPPAMQMLFALSAIAEKLWIKIILLKLPLFLSEVVTLLIIRLLILKKQLDSSAMALYAFHPLIIIEGVGNMHHEILLVPFLGAALMYAGRFSSGCFIAGAAAIKLTPIIWLPYFVFQSKSKVFTLLLCIFILAIAFLPIMTHGAFAHYAKALYEYLHSFSFNRVFVAPAWLTGFVVITAIALLSFHKHKNVPTLLGVVFLALSSTIHPWYLIPLLFFNLTARLKAVWLWSLTIVLSYFHYQYLPFQTPAWVPWAVHLPPALVLLTELWQSKNRKERDIINLINFER